MTSYQETGGAERVAGGWRAIGSAWLLVALGLGLLIGLSSFAGGCEAWLHSPAAVEHVIVPHHDPSASPVPDEGLAYAPM